jgi:hypothetical protein
VESEASSFRPHGEKVGSYVKRAAVAKGKSKGKGKEKPKGKGNGTAAKFEDGELKEDDEDAVVFEMYKVNSISCCGTSLMRTSQHGVLLASGNITVECSCLFCCISRGAVLYT